MNLQYLFNKIDKRRFFKKCLPATVALVFLFSIYTSDLAPAKVINTPIPDISYRALFSIENIRIPKDNGNIKEVYKGTNGKLIIHIQDAHVNYEGQKNLAGILKDLIEKYGINLILVEGGWGEVGLSFLRDFATKNIREEIADEYLKKGKIAGEEYLDIVSDPDLRFHLYGIEDKALYNANLDQFLKIDKFVDEANLFLDSLDRSLNFLKDRPALEKISRDLNLIKNFVNLRLSPNDLKEYQSRKKDFNLKEWARFINYLAKRYNLPQALIHYNPVIDQNLRKLEQFYRIAKRRDKAFFKNSIMVMKQKEQIQAVLIAGGFHTENLMDLFKDEDYSYIVVSPKVTGETDLALYRSILKAV